MVIASKNDLHLTMGGGSAIFAGNRIYIKEGGGNLIASGGGVSIEKGGAVLVAARDVKVSKSYVGLALGRSVEIAEDSHVMVTPLGALILGFTLGAMLGGVQLLLRRTR